MLHFVIEIEYTAAMERIEQVVPAHRAYYKAGYETGLLLCSGPQNPRVGGIAIARAETRENLDIFLKNDPYLLENVAIHRVKEFQPVLHQSFLSDWVSPDK